MVSPLPDLEVFLPMALGISKPGLTFWLLVDSRERWLW